MVPESHGEVTQYVIGSSYDAHKGYSSRLIGQSIPAQSIEDHVMDRREGRG